MRSIYVIRRISRYHFRRLMHVTRLAPSPTGALHLGNARTFLATWAIARQQGWRIVLRIEDLDGPRIKRGADDAALRDLKWLGIEWDGLPIQQSNRSEIYHRTITRLIHSGHAYPCICTRREVDLAASAPHAEDGSSIYPGTCRGRFASVNEARAAAGGREPSIRFRIPDDASSRVSWNDGLRGQQTIEARELGDFIIAKSDGTAAYQLAVVVDDVEQSVNEVIRGDDLVDSTPRQVLVYRALGYADRIPRYTHLPLVTGTDGRRLAKRHGDTRVDFYRSQRVPRDRLLALIGQWCGIGRSESLSPMVLLNQFRLANIPKGPVVFTSQDDAWLRQVANPIT